ncbi:hypothetical protein BDL97_08G014900 [Sphagnum fallax]|nr:hypothetical protein BDL97_08G014900 [Sphagnum fallax]
MAPGTIAGCCGPSLQTSSQRHEMNAGSSGGGSSSSSTTATNLTTEVVLVVARSRRRTLSSMENWVQCLPLLCMCTPMRMSSGSSNPTSELCTTREQVSGNSAADAGDESEPAGFVVGGDHQQSGSSRFSDETTGGRTATKKHRIPELKACPPAPRKPRAIARKRVQPIRFFTSPELEAFFSQYKLQAVKF